MQTILEEGSAKSLKLSGTLGLVDQMAQACRPHPGCWQHLCRTLPIKLTASGLLFQTVPLSEPLGYSDVIVCHFFQLLTHSFRFECQCIQREGKCRHPALRSLE